MLHRHSIILVLTGFAALFLACFSPVFFRDEQFGFRDAAHYYYPLYQRVQQEWDAGRVPLWELEENAGMPLLGNPTAAVLYPPKVIYAVFPYAWGARLYIVAHTALAFAAMLVLMRSWQTSWIGSGLSALAYAFGAPVLFQCCNVIFLVGAAWLPLGIHAVDRWVRCGRRWGLIELAVVLAMQTLGGDPQSAYLLGLAAVGYAAGLAWHRAAARREAEAAQLGGDLRRSTAWRWAGLVASLAVVWIAMTLVLGSWVPRFRPGGMPPKPLPWMPWVPGLVLAVWVLAGLGFVGYWAISFRRRHGWRLPLGIVWLGLAGSAALAAAVSAAQLLPVVEFTQQTSRAAEAGPHDIYPFSMAPLRLSGLFWPDFLGTAFGGATYWGDLVWMPGIPPHVWVPSLYLGAMTIVLAAGAFALRRTPPWRAWVSVIFLVSLVGSLGQYTSPIWLTRVLAEGTRLPALQSLARELGPLDPEDAAAIRQDGYLRDGDGSIYWLMATFLPGFRQFRYPAKLFTFTSLGLAALAGVGWDSIRAGASRRLTALTAALLAFTVVVLAGVLIGRGPILATFRASTRVSLYGPFNPDGAYVAMVRGLAHAAVVLGLGLAAIRLAGRRPMLAGALVLGVATVDLAVANRHYVLTVPQSTFEGTPEILRVIEEAERAKPSQGPYRVHRLPSWEPGSWHLERSADRGREVVKWERDTLQPKYGVPLGVHYAHVMGVAELYDYEWYYGGFLRKVRDADLARVLNVKIGDEVVYFPRRAFDMWNVRYFIVPLWPNGWKDSFRGYASMLLESEEIYPGLKQFNGPGGAEALKRWTETHDIQVFRNRREHPRAWAVHSVRKLPPLQGLRAGEERQMAMQEITYGNDPIWADSTRHVFDPFRVAWVEGEPVPGQGDNAIMALFHAVFGWEETGPLSRMAGSLSGSSPQPSETVKVTYPSPQHAELEVNMESPGLVVLADVYYPGWELTIDGVPAPIYRVNRLMRGAAVSRGHHRLVYTYNPRSYRIGLLVSAIGIATMVLLSLVCAFRPVGPSAGALFPPSPPEITGNEDDLNARGPADPGPDVNPHGPDSETTEGGPGSE